MNVGKKLLKTIVVIYSCTPLLFFGELPEKMVRDMWQALQYLAVPEHIIKQIQIKELSKEEVKKGHASYTRFEGGDYPTIIIGLNQNMFNSYTDPVRQLLTNYTLLREAVCVSYFSKVRVPYGQYCKDRQYYKRVNSGYQRYLSLVKKLEKSLKESFAFIFVLGVSFQWLNKIGIKRKILDGLALISLANVCTNLFNSYKNSEELSVYRDAKNYYIKMLEPIACKEPGSIIDHLGACKQRFDSSDSEFLQKVEKEYANFPDEDEEIFRGYVRGSPQYNRGKCIQMRDNFLVNVGTLAVMFYRDQKSYNEYIKHLDNDINVKINCHNIFPFASLDKRLYINEFIRNVNSEKEVKTNLWDAGENRGPYAKVVDDYLRENILGIFEKNLQVHQGNIKEYIMVRKQDLQVYQGNIREYVRAIGEGKRPIHARLQEPAWWGKISPGTSLVE